MYAKFLDFTVYSSHNDWMHFFPHIFINVPVEKNKIKWNKIEISLSSVKKQKIKKNNMKKIEWMKDKR